MKQTAIVTIDTADIARMLNVGRAHVTDRLSKELDFPAPVIDLSQKVRRWDQHEVLLWIKKRTERRNSQRR